MVQNLGKLDSIKLLLVFLFHFKAFLPKHPTRQVELPGITTANPQDSDCLHDATLSSVSLETCRAALTTKMNSSEGKVIGKNEEGYKWKPNYVYFEGHYYHMATFLSLNEGKVYRPGSSRMARGMAPSQNDLYDKVHMLLKLMVRGVRQLPSMIILLFTMKVMTISTLAELFGL